MHLVRLKLKDGPPLKKGQKGREAENMVQQVGQGGLSKRTTLPTKQTCYTL
jgi:hypothetical protein